MNIQPANPTLWHNTPDGVADGRKYQFAYKGRTLDASGTNADGAYPTGGLVLDGNTLDGTTYRGGTSNGVVFARQTDGGGYSVLK